MRSGFFYMAVFGIYDCLFRAVRKGSINPPAPPLRHTFIFMPYNSTNLSFFAKRNSM